MEKFSIDIETYYITDSGEQPNVFNLSPAEKRQTVLGEDRFLHITVVHVYGCASVVAVTQA